MHVRSHAAALPASHLCSLDALYRAHKGTVARFAVTLGGPHEEVEDLVQEVFVVAASRLSTFRGEADVRTWLYGITRNVVRHRRRSAHRARRRTVELSLALEPVSDAPTPEQTLASRQALASVCTALAELDEKYRATLLLHAVEGLDGREIAEKTGVEPATVWVRLHRARLLIQHALIKGAIILIMIGAGAAIAAHLARKVEPPPATNERGENEMKRHPKKFIAAAFLAGGLTALPAVAAATEPEKEETQIVYPKKMVVEFSEVRLSGELARPDGSYLQSRKKSHFLPFVRVRTDFRPELLRSIDAL